MDRFVWWCEGSKRWLVAERGKEINPGEYEYAIPTRDGRCIHGSLEMGVAVGYSYKHLKNARFRAAKMYGGEE